ncbi:MarR family winged helix-turn-helix transcriptional regulator [Ligilactobacillus sp. LYQ135]
MNEREQYIDDALKRIYADIMWIEEKELKKSSFKDLSIKEVHAIKAITMYSHQTASEVAKKLHLTPGTLTTTVDRLVRKNYVRRIPASDDRRVIRLGLTPKGRLVYRAHEAFHRKMVKSFLMDLDQGEVDTIYKAVRNLEAFLKAHS